MIIMRHVGRSHILALDTSTDASHLLNFDEEVLFTFNSSTEGYTPDGEILCRLHLRNNHWICANELGIECKPVSFDLAEGVFDVEAEFCEKWLQLQGTSHEAKKEQGEGARSKEASPQGSV
jgi:hypothetical protein